jgi:hypothetical protein
LSLTTSQRAPQAQGIDALLHRDEEIHPGANFRMAS